MVQHAVMVRAFSEVFCILDGCGSRASNTLILAIESRELRLKTIENLENLKFGIADRHKHALNV
jgi:hypothetical protein